MRSPRTPKIRPPVAQPTMKMAVTRAGVEVLATRGALAVTGLQGRHAGQKEQLLIHAVEQPAEGGDEQDEPVIGGQAAPPRALAAVG